MRHALRALAANCLAAASLGAATGDAIILANPETGEVRDFESGSGTANRRALEGSGEVIWFSKRHNASWASGTPGWTWTG